MGLTRRDFVCWNTLGTVLGGAAGTFIAPGFRRVNEVINVGKATSEVVDMHQPVEAKKKGQAKAELKHKAPVSTPTLNDFAVGAPTGALVVGKSAHHFVSMFNDSLVDRDGYRQMLSNFRIATDKGQVTLADGQSIWSLASFIEQFTNPEAKKALENCPNEREQISGLLKDAISFAAMRGDLKSVQLIMDEETSNFFYIKESVALNRIGQGLAAADETITEVTRQWSGDSDERLSSVLLRKYPRCDLEIERNDDRELLMTVNPEGQSQNFKLKINKQGLAEIHKLVDVIETHNAAIKTTKDSADARRETLKASLDSPHEVLV
ncbi:MAG: hypothetical protein HOA17_08925 [Candidatus Melainabacteria bacterium]|nr:hypothetical protein [Candidatus Melainabacteria bacterium]